MFQVYGHGAKVSKEALPHAYLLADIMAEWPDKTTPLKSIVDKYKGHIIVKFFICYTGHLCELCHKYPKPEERKNIHHFLDAIYEAYRNLKYRIKLELVTFLNQHGSALFERQGPMTHLLPHYRLKKSINTERFKHVSSVSRQPSNYQHGSQI